MSDETLDRLCVDTVRMLAIDAVEAANSGHPGLPLGAAPMAYALWSRILNHNPANPAWINRDRFILSAGHGSSLLYALLHLFGYDLSLEEVKNFRQMGAKTPGHPEYGHTAGVEATTGPLGAGFAMGVGMAMAERQLGHEVNEIGHPLIDHYTYALVSDGDLMEGISAEAAALAGRHGLGKLIYLYDDNRISIEGSTQIAFTEDVTKRFEAAEWQVLTVVDGEDLDAIENAVRQAQEEKNKPSLIRVRTVIGRGSPKADTASVHGSPIKGEGMEATRKFYHWPEERFHIPAEARARFQEAIDRGLRAEGDWNARLDRYRSSNGDGASAFYARTSGVLPNNWEAALPAFDPAGKAIATRAASGQVLNALAPVLPGLIGGSSDLGPSNNTDLKEFPDRTLHFGVREHAMGAIVNGMALHGGFLPYGGTFLVFSDYMRAPLRLAALMDIHALFVLTHDSIAVGEDGPTHQPVEHIASLRAIPGLLVFRPADANETAAAWRLMIGKRRPAVLALSRQGLPILEVQADGVDRGAYVAADCEGEPEVILIGTGGETQLAIKAQAELADKGVKARAVSMPCWELFEEQDQAYRDKVLPPTVTARVSVEAGTTQGWHKWVGLNGKVIGIDRFGTSAPGGEALAHFGFTVEAVVQAALDVTGS